MRIREAAIAAAALVAVHGTRAAAQATRDRPTLVFTISGAYIDGGGI